MSNYVVWIAALLALLLWLGWRYYIGQPLRKMANAAQKVAKGDFTVQIEPRERIKRKNEIDVLIEDFNTMTQELAGNEVLKNDFIANVSHEIKTPLSIIQSYTRLCGRMLCRRRNASSTERSSGPDKLNAMIANVRNSASWKISIFWEFDVSAGRAAAALLMTSWNSGKPRTSRSEIDVVDVAVHHDASLLELVWNNLLANAIKFTDPGGTISLTSEVADGAVYVTLRDTGCGMDAATKARIFEKFYQGDHSRAAAGNGLGLTLAKRVVDIAGGEIAVESTPGKGSVFTVKLPL